MPHRPVSGGSGDMQLGVAGHRAPHRAGGDLPHTLRSGRKSHPPKNIIALPRPPQGAASLSCGASDCCTFPGKPCGRNTAPPLGKSVQWGREERPSALAGLGGIAVVEDGLGGWLVQGGAVGARARSRVCAVGASGGHSSALRAVGGSFSRCCLVRSRVRHSL
jgi:hypothetical protein